MRKDTRFLYTAIFYCLVGMHSSNVFAIPIDVKADFYFGPDISRNQACDNARETAKSKAIAMVTGEKVSFDQQLQCFQNPRKGEERKCEINQNSSVLVEGRIGKSETISETVKTVPGAQVCTVLMVVHQRNLLSVADRVLVMQDGTVSQFGTLAELSAAAPKATVAQTRTTS